MMSQIGHFDSLVIKWGEQKVDANKAQLESQDILFSWWWTLSTTKKKHGKRFPLYPSPIPLSRTTLHKNIGQHVKTCVNQYTIYLQQVFSF